jgi:hypothetical protein
MLHRAGKAASPKVYHRARYIIPLNIVTHSGVVDGAKCAYWYADFKLNFPLRIRF